jgi:hypothetical protein
MRLFHASPRKRDAVIYRYVIRTGNPFKIKAFGLWCRSIVDMRLSVVRKPWWTFLRRPVAA